MTDDADTQNTGRRIQSVENACEIIEAVQKKKKKKKT